MSHALIVAVPGSADAGIWIALEKEPLEPETVLNVVVVTSMNEIVMGLRAPK